MLGSDPAAKEEAKVICVGRGGQLNTNNIHDVVSDILL